MYMLKVNPGYLFRWLLETTIGTTSITSWVSYS